MWTNMDIKKGQVSQIPNQKHKNAPAKCYVENLPSKVC